MKKLNNRIFIIICLFVLIGIVCAYILYYIAEADDKYVSTPKEEIVISAAIKKDGSYGPLVLDGENNDFATLNDIPSHAQLNNGDTIVTSPYSTKFKENILIGTVENFKQDPGKPFFTVKVRLLASFKKLIHTNGQANEFRKEQK